MAKESYIFKVAPDYNNVTFYPANGGAVNMWEWSKRTAEEFNEGMKGRGFQYRTETYTLSSGQFVEHIWEKFR